MTSKKAEKLLEKGKRVKLVIAGNHREFDTWYAFAKRLKGYENCRFISSIDKLYGYEPNSVEIVLVGQYWKNPAYGSNRYYFLGGNAVVITPPKGNL